jgi:fibronectin-binding autotransporter adhesin
VLRRMSIAVIAPLIAVLGLWAAPAGAATHAASHPARAHVQHARPKIRPAAPRGRHAPRQARFTPDALPLHPAVANVLTHIAHHFVVKSLGDTHESPSNGTTCHDAGGHCTLRAAIETANNASGVDLITIAKAGTITLSNLINTPLAPTTRMVIQGLGAAKTHISGVNCACYIFDIESGTGGDPAVEIDDMTITKGQDTGVYIGSAAVILDHDVISSNDLGGADSGGGIYVADTDSQMWLTHSTVSANKGQYGGGIYLNYGAVVLSGDTIGGTKAAGGNVAMHEGGGIYNDDGVLSIYATHVDHNKATNSGGASGGGIYNCCYTLSMQGGSISNNVVNAGTSSGYGGGLYAESSYPEQLNGVAVNGNSITGTYGDGGGIYDDTYMQLSSTQVNGNTITLTGDGDSAYGAGISDEEQLQMVGGSLSGNQIVRGTAVSYIDAYGAGFYEDDYGSFDGVKISGNKALAGGSSGNAYGGGGYSTYNSRFSGLVVSGNVASGHDAYGAGLYLDPSYATHIGRSTFSGNTINAVAYGEGGAIDQEGDDLVLTNVTITNTKSNATAGGVEGGALWCEYVCNMDTVSISKTASTATESSGPYVYGGAVYADYQAKWNKVKVTGTTNWAHGASGYVYGGVVYQNEVSEFNGVSVATTKNTVGPGGYIYGGDLYGDDTLQADGVTFNGTTNNVAGPGGYLYGGAILLYDVTNLTRVKALGTTDNLPGDGSYVYGGSVYVDDYLTAVNLSVVGTKVAVGTNGYVYGGGVVDYDVSSFDRATIAKTTVTAKGASSFIEGGGMYLDDGMNVVNSTISDNVVKSPGNTSTYGGYGGGVYANDMITFTNDTIVGNSASRTGGGVYDDDYINTFHNTIVSGNTGKNCAVYPGSTLLSAGHNLESGTSCKFTSWGDLNKPAHLGLLKMNGGFAPTMMPLPTSLAINHGGNGGCPAVDERGVLRPQGPSCDIGAVEVKPIKKK